MDSITQATLGAALAVACAPRAPAARMMLYGAAAGTLPDLDVLAELFVSDVQSFTGHRSATHSLLMLPIAAVLLAWGAARIGLADLSFRRWWLVLTAVLLTHPLLDLLTSYGTQLFWPLSRHPYSTSSIFIIDPLYTLPLLLGLYVVYAEERRGSPAADASATSTVAPTGKRRGRRWLTAALLWGCLYLAGSLVVKIIAQATAQRTLPVPQASLSSWQVQSHLPTVLTWRAIAVGADATYQTTLYFWQSASSLRWQQRPHYSRRTEVIALMRTSTEHGQLMDFSKGLFDLREQQGRIFYRDLRFARSDELSTFSFEVAHLSPTGELLLVQPRRLPSQF